MTSITDKEFGEIVIHRRRGSHNVSIKMGTDGRLVATVPPYTPLLFVKQVIHSSRDQLRTIITATAPVQAYEHGQPIGKHHTLAVVVTGMVTAPTVKIQRQTLILYVSDDTDLTKQEVQQLIRDNVVTILRREAKAYLPDRLAAFARDNGFTYKRVTFTHASGRWGSCSSTGTISLNIALMKLPDELIDYVLIHELCHTRHMNHSPSFWREVERYDPHFRLHRRQLKRESPSV